ncbi:hypothetical protein BVG19_g3335 [[Candida] boidinii]|nr:hypothetical protein BVG19_g3335 [[Candida] boidinii]OWB52124.1 hypothetical protein B5S27_g3696 [[Candida] boidinii]OWB85454.1 hypothetical protein B5S33_g4121 [[Candida] boidinii]
MNLTITYEATGQILTVELPSDFKFNDFKAYLEAETNLKPLEQIIIFNSKSINLPSNENKDLGELGITDGDLLLLSKKIVQPSSTANSNTTTTNTAGNSNNGNDNFDIQMLRNNPMISHQIEAQREQFLKDPNLQARLDPELALNLNDKDRFKEIMLNLMQRKSEFEIKQRNELKEIENNPDDPENQKRILEIINQQAIEENLKIAYETSPESFTQVHMLYVNLKVNGYPVKAFVDSGAQMTIISPSLAERCGVSRLIDRRMKGEARGVGKQEILGRIHSVPLSIENTFFNCSFTVLDTNVDMLLGLDMLRRHQACIDLRQNKLIIGNVETEFLNESEIPKDTFNGVGSGATTSTGQPLGGNIFSPEANPNPNHTPFASSTSSSSSAAATAAARAATARLASSSNSSSTVVADPVKVQQLVNMGFKKEEVEFALQQCNNNIDLAAGLLFG